MSRKISVNLGLSDLKKLKKELIAMKSDMNNLGNIIVRELVTQGTLMLNSNIGAISNLDGNSPGAVQSTVFGPVGQISQSGDQVIFLEFGTGIPGMIATHPRAGAIGYSYNTKRSARAHRVRSSDGLEGWWYKNLTTNMSTFTPGIRGNWQMYNTAMYLRGITSLVVKDALRGVLK